PSGLAAVVAAAGVDELAVATPGTAEGGHHIADPRTGRSAATDLAAVTGVGPGLTWAARCATEAVPQGARAGVGWRQALPVRDGLAGGARVAGVVAGGGGAAHHGGGRSPLYGGVGGQAGVRRRAAAGRGWVCAVPRAPGERALAVVVTCGPLRGLAQFPAPLR